jgi:polar amino acid transport system substrate-binding protein
MSLSSAARAELTPTGKTRFGINFGNTALVTRDEQGAPRGIAVELAKELQRRMGTPHEWIRYEAAGPMADGAAANAWDVAFLAADPVRSREIAFTAPYLEIDSTYLVARSSSFETPADIDRGGIRIAASRGSAYDLFLSRNLKRAELVRAANPKDAANLFASNHVDVLAGIRPMLLEAARTLPHSRVLDGRFASAQQAIGTPAGRKAAAEYLETFIEDIKASGLLARVAAESGIPGLALVP